MQGKGRKMNMHGHGQNFIPHHHQHMGPQPMQRGMQMPPASQVPHAGLAQFGTPVFNHIPQTQSNQQFMYPPISAHAQPVPASQLPQIPGNLFHQDTPFLMCIPMVFNTRDHTWNCQNGVIIPPNTQTFLAGYHIIYQGSPHAPHHMQNGFSQNISHAQPQPLSPNDSPGFSYTESNSSGSRENLGHEQANGSPVLHNSVSMGPTLPVGVAYPSGSLSHSQYVPAHAPDKPSQGSPSVSRAAVLNQQSEINGNGNVDDNYSSRPSSLDEAELAEASEVDRTSSEELENITVENSGGMKDDQRYNGLLENVHIHVHVDEDAADEFSENVEEGSPVEMRPIDPEMRATDIGTPAVRSVNDSRAATPQNEVQNGKAMLTITGEPVNLTSVTLDDQTGASKSEKGPQPSGPKSWATIVRSPSGNGNYKPVLPPAMKNPDPANGKPPVHSNTSLNDRKRQDGTRSPPANFSNMTFRQGGNGYSGNGNYGGPRPNIRPQQTQFEFPKLSREDAEKYPIDHQIYMKSLPKNVTTTMIANAMRSFGELEDVRLRYHRDSQANYLSDSSRFCFVLFRSRDPVKELLKRQTVQIGDITVNVQEPFAHNTGQFQKFNGYRTGDHKSTPLAAHDNKKT